AAAVVAIAAETIKTVAMRVFHWNMTPPPTSRTSQRQKWRAGFACEGAAAYMGLTWRAPNSLTICSELRARKSGEIESRLVRLGRNAPSVSGRGCMGMSVGYGHAGDAESIATIHAALEAGITMLDTGDFYGAGIGLQREPLVGRSPRILGELLKLGFELVESTAPST